MSATFVRFLLVGVVNTLAGLSVTFALRYGFGWQYWPSTLAGLMIGALTSYFLNRKYTFKSHAAISSSAARFAAVVLFCYFIAFESGRLIATRMASYLHLSPMMTDDLAVLIGTTSYTLANYWGQKLFVFRLKRFRAGQA